MRIGQDKLLHFLVCFALDIILASTALWTPVQRVVIVAIIGAAKEYYDMKHEGHDAEWLDFVADLLGAFAGELAVLILHG